jgi:hypothetical protein
MRGSGSTEPTAVVPSVTTTVPTSPRARRSSSARTSSLRALVDGDRLAREPEHFADAPMRVVRLARREDHASRP